MSSLPRRLEGKVAVVTGASRGIGRGIADRLAAEGAVVVVNYSGSASHAEPLLERIAGRGDTAWGYRADVASKAEVDAMVADTVERAGRLDVMVCNAGICEMTEWDEITEELWDRTHDVNLKGTFLCAQAGARVMVERGEGGRLIAISSINAIVGGSKQIHYGPTKAGQRSLMNHFAVALGKHGITCNTVLPGTILTSLNEEFLEPPEVREHYSQRIALGRIGDPADIAGAVAYLASEEGSYVTGAELLIDGGALVNFA